VRVPLHYLIAQIIFFGQIKILAGCTWSLRRARLHYGVLGEGRGEAWSYIFVPVICCLCVNGSPLSLCWIFVLCCVCACVRVCLCAADMGGEDLDCRGTACGWHYNPAGSMVVYVRTCQWIYCWVVMKKRREGKSDLSDRSQR
jgi:hypothetical protein